MIYTVYVREIRRTEIRADDREHLRRIMEDSFKAQPASEREEWRVQYAQDDAGKSAVVADLDMFWHTFPREDDEES